MAITQRDAPARVDSPLGVDVLLLEGCSGTEYVSRPFRFAVDLLSERSGIGADDLLRKPLVLSMRLPNGTTRHLHGLVARFCTGGRRDGLSRYRVDIVPWFWLLSLGQDSRVFQKLTVLEIATRLFTEHGFHDFEFRTVRTYKPREFCVQYRESAFNFVARLLEDEGIAWFVEHHADRHVVVLTDAPTSHRATLDPSELPVRASDSTPSDGGVIYRVLREDVVHVGSVALDDYNPVVPSLDLRATLSGTGVDEVFDWPGGYSEVDDGERRARLALEAREAEAVRIEGSSTAQQLAAGQVVTLTDVASAAVGGRWMLLSVTHELRAGDVRSWGSAPFGYRNEFTAIPAAVPYRPTGTATRPRVHGTQPAVVVGAPGKTIDVDRLGRITVRFCWDRRSTGDHRSSCRVRVASSWAGKGWGAVSHPRVGQEVIVDFLEGDPDRPIVVGRVYNGEQLPPYPLPAHANRTGLTSSSVGAAGYNEISLDDSGSAEGITIHAQKDMSTTVKNDAHTKVGRDASVKVGNDKKESVKNGYTLEAKDIVIKAGSSITLKCGDSKLEMNQAGVVTLSGTIVTVSGAVTTAVSAPVTSVAGAVALSLTGAIVFSGSGAGMLWTADSLTLAATKIKLNA